MASEDILLRHNDQACRHEFKTREQRPQADIQGIFTQRVAELADERRNTPVRKELPQAVGFFLVTDQDQHSLLLRKPAIGFVFQEIHLPLERRHRRHGDPQRRLRFCSRDLLQHQRRIDQAIAACSIQQILPGKDLAWISGFSLTIVRISSRIRAGSSKMTVP